MNATKYSISFLLLIFLLMGCKKDSFTDTAFTSTAAGAGKLSVLFEITQDNTGLVTITPNGEGAVSYDIYFGDATNSPVNVIAGKSVKHVYAEGQYTVKVIGYNINGQSSQITQPLTVSFRAPENLKLTRSINGLTVNLSATAIYQTFFKVYFGDSNNVTPIPSVSFLQGQTVTHTFPKAGTYIMKVVALSGGAANTQILDTIKVAKPIDLPVTFEDLAVDYTMSDFGGNNSTLVTDPTNAANHVMKSIKTAGAQVWAGTTVGTAAGFANIIPIVASNKRMTVKVYSPAAGLDIKLKIEDHNDGTKSVETDVFTTVANQWETLTFDFNVPASGTPAWNPSNNYDKLSIFFDFGKTGSGSIFYFDDIKMAPPQLTQISLPVTFESATVDYTVTDFGNNATIDAIDPVNSANHVKKSTKVNGAQVWAGTTIGTPMGFSSKIPVTATASKMSVRVYSPAAGLLIKLKIEDHNNGANSVETDVKTTVANQWETLIFDFSQPSSGTPSLNPSFTYDKASIFFDFGNAGDGRSYYWDDVRFLQQINLPVTFDDPNVDYTVTDFGSNQSTIAADPASSSNTVMKSVKTNGAQTWAGTTIGTGAGFATAIPISASRTKMTVKVYSPAAGLVIKLKLEDHNNGANSVETDVKTTVANQWETLTFDFSQPAAGTPAWNASFTYDKASIFFDFGNAGSGKVFYWDNIIIL